MVDLNDSVDMQAIHRLLSPEVRIAVIQVADVAVLHQMLDQANGIMHACFNVTLLG